MDEAVRDLELTTRIGGILDFKFIRSHPPIVELCEPNLANIGVLIQTLKKRGWTPFKEDTNGMPRWRRPEPVLPPARAVVNVKKADEDAPATMLDTLIARGLCDAAGDTASLKPTAERTTLVLCDLGGGNQVVEQLIPTLTNVPDLTKYVRIIACADKHFNAYPARQQDWADLPDGVVCARTNVDVSDTTDAILITAATEWLSRYGRLCKELDICITSGDNLLIKAAAEVFKALAPKNARISTFYPSAHAKDLKAINAFISKHCIDPYM